MTLVQDDPTWALEYAHFKRLVQLRVRRPILANDLWLHRVLQRLGAEADRPREVRDEARRSSASPA